MSANYPVTINSRIADKKDEEAIVEDSRVKLGSIHYRGRRKLAIYRKMANQSPTLPDTHSQSNNLQDAAIPLDLSGEKCLFVANLPQRMNNEELAWSLWNIFKPFGEIVSIKASRDQRGRPFGFIEYKEEESAKSAFDYGAWLHLDNRKIRVEIAKTQAKLCIKWAVENDIGEAMEIMRSELLQWVHEKSLKLSIQESPEANIVLLAALVKFDDLQTANEAFLNLKAKSDKKFWGNDVWTFTWINLNRSMNGSLVRNSGLVQLVPSEDPLIKGNGNVWYPQNMIQQSSPQNHSLQLPFIQNTLSPAPSFKPKYEEEFLRSSDIAGNNVVIEMDIKGKVLFIGRLNGQLVTIDDLIEKFKEMGNILYVRLYNRGVFGFDGVPLDAYALLLFAEDGAVDRAIEKMNSQPWLGQSVKCEHARVGRLFEGSPPSNGK